MIPFVVIPVVTAIIGLGKAGHGFVSQSKANSINNEAQEIIDKAKKLTNASRKCSGDAVERLGKTKIDILNGSVDSFVQTFEKIHNIELKDSAGIGELKNIPFDKQSFVELKEMKKMASSLLGGAASGVVAGTITAFGAYGAVSAFAAASTGTAISALSGAAATNATLAFLGGGSLAAGGLGVAGGTAVLGGLVAGPALAVLGFVVDAKASANKDRAYANLAEAQKFDEEMKTARTFCNGIRRRADMFSRALMQLDAIFIPLVASLEKTVSNAGTDYSAYTQPQKETVAACLSMAGAIKAVLDVPILTEDGALTEESKALPNIAQEAINAARA